MERKMFCYQCQETARNTGCEISGVCGKTSHTANLQDLLIYVSTGLSEVLIKARDTNMNMKEAYEDRINMNLFTTITNANFSDESLKEMILKTVHMKEDVRSQLHADIQLSKCALWNGDNDQAFEECINEIGVLSVIDDDLRSLKELITYGLKGMAAYNKHAHALGKRNQKIDEFIQDTLTKMEVQDLSLNDYIELTMKTGEYGVQVMALLDEANTSRYGHPEITNVNIAVGKRPGILVSGHDLYDLEQLLEQSKDSGIDIYTHSEMLPAHYYPFFKKYKHFFGNYGNAWWKQKEEFESFRGPILLTTNCLVPPKDSYKNRIYTTGAVHVNGCLHINSVISGQKDFTTIIEHAKNCLAPIEIESGSIIGGFAHQQVLSLTDKIVEAVRNGAIKKFVVMAGCDGRSNARNYYTDFAKELPSDTIILTAGCAKYKYNKLKLGDINGIPRVLDAGQCNDSYSLALIALKLKEVFELEDINELPIIYNIAWYEQKAVIVLLALLSLGIKDIHLGPTLPAFLSPNVAKYLVETFGIAGISTVEDDLTKFFPKKHTKNGIHKDMLIGDILRIHPVAERILEENGMGCMGCPASQSESLEDACFVHGIDVNDILDKLVRK